MQIPITKTFFGEEEKQAVVKPLETGWVVQGPNVAEFERLFAEHTKTEYACASSNCTTALHLALIALGIKTGDKVVVPSFTYIASQNSVEYTGAEVVFCDINLSTFNIDTEKLLHILQNDKEKQIKAIIPVNLFGLCADMPKIIKIAEDYNLKVVEDSACAFDSWIGNKHAGTFGDVGCFSFHPRKAICTGEGGMLITSDKDISDTVKSLRDHGAEKSDLQRHKEKGGSLLPEFKMRGYNYRMTDIQGAIGVCQMKKADYIMSGRKRIARKYNEALKPFSFLKTPFVPENFTHGYQSYVCLFSDVPIEELNFAKVQKLNLLRNTFMEKLEENGIATRQGTHAVHTLAYYKQKYGLQDEDYFYSYAADRLSITLPVYADMTDEEFDYVIKNIREFAPICVE